MVIFSTKALPDRAGFALNLLEYILNATLPDNPALPQYSDAVKDLERTCSVEMQKLAMAFPDQFMVRTPICTIGFVLITVIGRI